MDDEIIAKIEETQAELIRLHNLAAQRPGNKVGLSAADELAYYMSALSSGPGRKA